MSEGEQPALLSFNMLLRAGGIDPCHVRLLRHQAQGAAGATPFRLWHDRRDLFDAYQASQLVRNRQRLAAPYWASFIVAPDGRTIFAGLYSRSGTQPLPMDWPYPLTPRSTEPEELHTLAQADALNVYAGRLAIEWGGATRTWIQRADMQDKVIVELARTIAEPEFPGFSSFIAPLSQIAALPSSWATALAAARGIYLLACPRTGELYVGSAIGARGFIGRWQAYVADGHGDNVALRAREPSDYQISILEVAGSLASDYDILALEARWKAKLKSREAGLNRN